MRPPDTITTAALLLLLPGVSFAAEVDLPAPVLEWSFYILLIFAVCVGFGIFFFSKGKTGKHESVGNLISDKDASVHSVSPDVLVADCVSQMNEHRIGAMLVIDKEELLGIFTERDAITKVLGGGMEQSNTKISAVMTRDPICITTATTLDEALGIVTTQRIRHLPVVEDGKVLGMVSSGDLTHRLVEPHTLEVQDLVDIAGRRRASR